jgi:hypothetical protein
VAELREESQGGTRSSVSFYEDLILRVGRTVQRRASASRPQSPLTPPRTDENTQTENHENPAPDGEKSGPLRHGDEKSSPVRWEKMEHLLGKMLETQLQESNRRRRALKARRHREKRRSRKDASLNQQPQEFPTTLPYGPPLTTGIVDIPPAAGTGTLPEIEEWIIPDEIIREESEHVPDHEHLTTQTESLDYRKAVDESSRESDAQRPEVRPQITEESLAEADEEKPVQVTPPTKAQIRRDRHSRSGTTWGKYRTQKE